MRHSSHLWENHLPSGFAFAWEAGLIAAASYGDRLGVAVTVLTGSLIALGLVEAFHPKRQP